jgi:hypothetical protein
MDPAVPADECNDLMQRRQEASGAIRRLPYPRILSGGPAFQCAMEPGLDHRL